VIGERRQAPDGQWQELRADGYWYPIGTPNPSAPTAGASTVPAGGWLAIIAGLIIGISSVLPWVTASVPTETVSRNGFQLGNHFGFSWDGVIAMVLGVITVIIGVVRLTNSSPPRFMARSAIATGIGAALIFGNRYGDLQDYARQFNGSQFVTASVAYGFWLLAVGAGIAIVSGLILRTKPPEAFQIPPPVSTPPPQGIKDRLGLIDRAAPGSWVPPQSEK
jgi:hypothetical protein